MMWVRRLICFTALLLGLFLTFFILDALGNIKLVIAQGTIYYVDAATGNDSYTPAQAQNPSTPWKTISHAVSTVPGGTDASRDVIQVKSGIYDATNNGESFPLVMENPYIQLVGEGAAFTIINSEYATETFTVSGQGIAIEGFTIEHAKNYAIHANEGDLVVRNNVISDVNNGIRINLIESITNSTRIIGDLSVVSNSFNVGRSAVNIDVWMYGADSASSVTLGDINILSNTMTAYYNWGYMVDISEIYFDNFISGQITVGNVSIQANEIYSGIVGISFFGGFDNITNTQVSAGDVVITGNECVGQGDGGISVDYYDAYEWYSATTGIFGALAISDNTIYGGDHNFGIEVEDLSYFYLYDDSSLAVGAVSMLNNNIDVENKGIYIDFYELNSYGDSTIICGGGTFYGNTIRGHDGIWLDVINAIDEGSISLQDISFISNTIDVRGEGLYLDFIIDGANTDSSFSIGDIQALSNTITLPESGGYGIDIDDIYAMNFISGEISIGEINLSANEIISGGTGLLFYGGVDAITDTIVTVGDVVVSNNVFIDQIDESIFIDYYDASGWYGDSAGVFGDLKIGGNQITAPDAGSGIVLDDVGFWSIFDRSSLEIGSLEVDSNTIEVTDLGVYVYYINIELEDESDFTRGGVSFTDNVIQADDGIDVYYENVIVANESTSMGDLLIISNTLDAELYGILLDQVMDGSGSGSEVFIGDFHLVSNTITLPDSLGTGIEITDIYLEDFVNGQIDIGQVNVSDNEIISGTTGILFYGGIDTISNTLVRVGDLNVLNNNFRDQSLEAINLDYYDASDWYGTTTGIYGELHIGDNMVASHYDGNTGIHLNDLGYHNYLYDDASLTFGGVTVEGNQIDAGSFGLNLLYKAVNNIHDQVAVHLGESEISNNTFLADNGIGITYDLIGYSISGNSGITIDGLSIINNNLSAETGVSISFDQVASSLSDAASFVMSDILVENNSITTTQDGLLVLAPVGSMNMNNGPGVTVRLPDYVIDGNVFVEGSRGAYLETGADVDLYNNLFTRQKNYGIYAKTDSTTVQLVHNTIASPTVSTGAAVYVLSGTLEITNTIIASFTTGIENVDGVVHEDYNLFYGTGDSISGTVTSGGHSLDPADPAFEDLAAGDYHLGASSVAINQGTDTGVTVDLDGEPRDLEPDIGAYEYRTCWARLNNDPADYGHAQAAVDASASTTDLVKVAGYCRGVNAYGGLAQAVYISKTLTIQGGYTLTNWTESDPVANLTTLDAEGLGRVLYVTDTPDNPGQPITPTIMGLILTGGDAAGLNGGPSGEDAGGGVYVITATVTLSSNLIHDNAATFGGGVGMARSAGLLAGNQVFNNQGVYGGGIALGDSDGAVLSSNTVYSNTVFESGGGIALGLTDDTMIEGNVIYGNRANEYGGGGVFAESNNVSLIGNTIRDNIAAVYSDGYGGGLAFYSGCQDALMQDNLIENNTASAVSDGYGG
ncbi:MAG: right-handed parallel beta-helix repeat-containing protein, partial [Anaerolineales bacterium]|nr:right-handed parallel beta-helix repeat-containing protein [Anaerolineales bacterium]